MLKRNRSKSRNCPRARAAPWWASRRTQYRFCSCASALLSWCDRFSRFFPLRLLARRDVEVAVVVAERTFERTERCCVLCAAVPLKARALRQDKTAALAVVEKIYEKCAGARRVCLTPGCRHCFELEHAYDDLVASPPAPQDMPKCINEVQKAPAQSNCG